MSNPNPNTNPNPKGTNVTKPFNPADYGITLEFSVENLLNARSQYVKITDSQKSETVKSEAPKLENEDDQKRADAFIVEFRNQLFGTLDDAPILSTVLVDSIATVLKDLRDFRTWYVDDAIRKDRADVLPASDADVALKELKNWVGLLYNGVKSFGLPIPEDFPTKKLKDGTIVPSLPRGKNGPKKPKKVGGYFLRYNFYPGAFIGHDGTPSADAECVEIPAGTMVDEIAMRYISTPTYRVERMAVWEALTVDNGDRTPSGRVRRHLNLPKDGSSVFLPFESGVLEAFLPVDAPTEVLDEDDDDEDDED